MKKSISNTIIRRLLLTRPALQYTRIRHPRLFNNVDRFVLFIGHGRSGSSLVGALLNAHPNIVVSNELNVFDYLSDDRTREQLFNLVYDTARRQAKKGSRGGGGYTYAVPNQWQGRHKSIQVIGDRKAGATAIQLFRQPELASQLQDVLGIQLCFISVVRNPFDTLTTTLRKTIRFPDEPRNEHLKRQIQHYFERTSAIRDLCLEFGSNGMKFIYHDRLVTNPRAVVADLCQYLGVPANNDYLADCASIIQPKANITRSEIEWPAELVDLVETEIEKNPWLQEYCFADSN